MNSTAPKIGFDRFIALDWAATALKIRANMASMEELAQMLDQAGLSLPARKKIMTVLNRLWLAPRADLSEFAQRGVDLFQADPTLPLPALCWGMAIASYPFFGKVAEIIGRLSALQGDCAAGEVHRRMSEIYGEREGTYRMTNMVLQSQVSWGVLARSENGRRLHRCTPVTLNQEAMLVWLIEAVLRYAGRALSVPALPSMAVIFPFILNQPLAYLLAKSPGMELQHQASNEQLVMLRRVL